VKFTVHTRTSLKEFQKNDFSVVREHEEFLWLHDAIEENEEYAGYIVGFVFKLQLLSFKKIHSP
jgi:sorting nexin-5/6/32